MTPREINFIEEAFEVRLPSIYSEWLRTLPPAGLETKHWHYLFNDWEAVIEVNQDLRRNGCHESPWHPTLFCIGDADDNYFFMDLNDPESNIHYTNHDAGPYYDESNWRDCFYKNGREFFCEE